MKSNTPIYLAFQNNKPLAMESVSLEDDVKMLHRFI